MRFNQTKLRPLFRWMAGLTLLTWLGANVLCQSHCLLESCKGEDSSKTMAAESSHVDEHNAPSGSHDEKSTAACDTLKSALNQNSAALFITPTFAFLYDLAPAVLALNASAIKPASAIFRQPPDANRVLTPEVYLGPAFRSQAPPLAS